MVVRASSLFSMVCVAAPLFAADAPRAGMPFPATPSLIPGNIETDLLRSQREELADAEKKFSQDQKLSREQKKSAVSRLLQAKNKELPQELSRIAEDQRKRNLKGITHQQANQVLATVHRHPVIGLEASLKYDTWNQMIGYCFGRAAYIHWDLLRRGVAPSMIAKIFAVGGLRQKDADGFRWDYHVATIVRSTDSWWVIDPLIGRIMKVEPWIDKVTRMSSQTPSQLRFYLTDATKFHPIPGAYTPEKLLIPEYRGYFQDLFDWFRDHPIKKSDRFFSSSERSRGFTQ